MHPVASIVQPDGRILFAGDVGQAQQQVAVARFLSNGRLDRSFGAGGIATLSMRVASSLALEPDGKMILAGGSTSGNHAELVRLGATGALDPSFGSGGVVSFDYVANSSNAALVTVVQPDGKVLAGGFGLAPNSDVYFTSLARFEPDGTPDANFGTNGIVALDLVGGVTAVGLQTDGKLLVCGGFITPVTSLVVRFLPNGTLDRNDRGGSLASVAHTGSETADGTNEFQLDGKLVRWKTVIDRSGTHQFVELERLLRDNSPDPAFVRERFAFAAPTLYGNRPNDVEVVPNGALLVGGAGVRRGPSDTEVFGLARLASQGSLDDSFGRAGRVITSFAGEAESTALALQADGKIVSAGTITQGSGGQALALARYLGN